MYKVNSNHNYHGGEKLPLAIPAGEQLISRRKQISQLMLYIDQRILYILSRNLVYKQGVK
jgi:DNA recombination-dependent growth factor C